MGADLRRLPADARGGLAHRGRHFLGLAAGWLALDQATKLAVVLGFKTPGRSHVTLLPGYLDLTFTYNSGAAFGILNNVAWSRFLFAAIAFAALAAMVYWRRVILALPGPQRLGLALVAGGAAGNLVDRLCRGGLVVDFIHFHIARIGFVWPDFNVADIGVTCGMILYVAHAIWTDYQQARSASHDQPE
ncbi:MAG: signal peptidase II [Armatimonadetes bacterium]|nr:signal peptidase II [Armatimonadota bacterium]